MLSQVDLVNLRINAYRKLPPPKPLTIDDGLDVELDFPSLQENLIELTPEHLILSKVVFQGFVVSASKFDLFKSDIKYKLVAQRETQHALFSRQVVPEAKIENVIAKKDKMADDMKVIL